MTVVTSVAGLERSSLVRARPKPREAPVIRNEAILSSVRASGVELIESWSTGVGDGKCLFLDLLKDDASTLIRDLIDYSPCAALLSAHSDYSVILASTFIDLLDSMRLSAVFHSSMGTLQHKGILPRRIWLARRFHVASRPGRRK